jgi:hypothetical protein
VLGKKSWACTVSSAHVRTFAFSSQLGHCLVGLHQLVKLGVAHWALLPLEDDLSALLSVAEALVPARREGDVYRKVLWPRTNEKTGVSKHCGVRACAELPPLRSYGMHVTVGGASRQMEHSGGRAAAAVGWAVDAAAAAAAAWILRWKSGTAFG